MRHFHFLRLLLEGKPLHSDELCIEGTGSIQTGNCLDLFLREFWTAMGYIRFRA
jgi:hypothetical protein